MYAPCGDPGIVRQAQRQGQQPSAVGAVDQPPGWQQPSAEGGGAAGAVGRTGQQPAAHEQQPAGGAAPGAGGWPGQQPAGGGAGQQPAGGGGGTAGGWPGQQQAAHQLQVAGPAVAAWPGQQPSPANSWQQPAAAAGGWGAQPAPNAWQLHAAYAPPYGYPPQTYGYPSPYGGHPTGYPPSYAAYPPNPAPAAAPATAAAPAPTAAAAAAAAPAVTPPREWEVGMSAVDPNGTSLLTSPLIPSTSSSCHPLLRPPKPAKSLRYLPALSPHPIFPRSPLVAGVSTGVSPRSNCISLSSIRLVDRLSRRARHRLAVSLQWFPVRGRPLTQWSTTCYMTRGWLHASCVEQFSRRHEPCGVVCMETSLVARMMRG